MSDSGDGSRDAAYQAWFERMRNKKAKAAPVEEPPVDSSAYWSTESVFRESGFQESHEREAAARKSQIDTLLARLGLPPDASRSQVTAAYKRLAKAHHPDANVDSTSQSAQHHLEEMMELNQLYQALRSLMER